MVTSSTYERGTDERGERERERDGWMERGARERDGWMDGEGLMREGLRGREGGGMRREHQ